MIDIAHSLVQPIHEIATNFSNFDLTHLDLANNLNLVDLDWDHLFAQNNQAQQFDQDIGADFSKAWNNFIESGQWIALIVGLFLGYLFRTFTSTG
ncbi:hypothetical protein Pse7367_0093 [Thalassoporum mexicanum PCC 7367]|uniref:hypothetical protein n=1 Tax=Thalassoporum mexicanum TaxID=3457544 RepID=UPI00029FD286|nr:hypothetical protein [Pseudanabaena sp. PCC 7367]AFY68411.1 hypothetical protein Pse7367_0093 [Pseudanabaena sp. PCC 7367]